MKCCHSVISALFWNYLMKETTKMSLWKLAGLVQDKTHVQDILVVLSEVILELMNIMPCLACTPYG
jgi:hypothetical protein